MYIIYLRKSRLDSGAGTVSEVLERHEKILQEYAKSNFGCEIQENCIYREIVSGETIKDRPVIQAVLNRIQEEDVDGVLVVDPQRLSRGDLSDCGTIIRAFRYTSTLIITPTKTYDLSEKFDRKFFESELMRGNDYLEYVKEIMLRGRLASVSEGNFIGSVPPYGYDKVMVDKKPTLVINPAEADVVRLIFDLSIKESIGAGAIASRLNSLGFLPRKKDFWTASSITEILRNPVYIGKIRWNWRKTVKKYENGEIITSRPKSDSGTWTVTQGKHQPIISEETFNKVQSGIKNHPRIHKSKKLVNPFAGVLRCECGTAMSYQPQGKSEPRLHCPHQQHCGNKSATYKEVEDAVIQSIGTVIAELKAKSMKTKKDFSFNDAVKKIESELKTVESQQDKLYDLLEQGIYTNEIFMQRNGKLKAKQQQLEKSLKNAKALSVPEIDYEEKILALHEVLDILKNPDADAGTKNTLLKKSVKEIRYTRHTENHTKWDNTPFTLEVFLKL